MSETRSDELTQALDLAIKEILETTAVPSPNHPAAAACAAPAPSATACYCMLLQLAQVRMLLSHPLLLMPVLSEGDLAMPISLVPASANPSLGWDSGLSRTWLRWIGPNSWTVCARQRRSGRR